MPGRRRLLLAACAAATAPGAVLAQSVVLQPHRLTPTNGRPIELNLPPGFTIRIVAEGLKRPRFFAESPDRRVFVTDLLATFDTHDGIVYALDGLNPESATPIRPTPFATGLRNPNSVAFATDADGQSWLYMALTDRLVRYPYRPGDRTPRGTPQVRASFPDYGLDYRYGGWHLTRTIAVSPDGALHVSVGSSCNVCIEKEEIRASILRLNPDGSEARIIARGLRNAVGMIFVGDRLVATNMGADHLGRDSPDDTMFVVEPGRDYGWPHCYHQRGAVRVDPQFPNAGRCAAVPKPMAVFPAHSAPLGLAHFAASDGHTHPLLRDAYFVALQGAFEPGIRRGFKVVRVDASGRTSDFITGFMSPDGTIHGRPCDILPLGPNRFLLSDEKAGLIYFVSPAA